MWINQPRGLLELCSIVDRSAVVAIDTEFAAERRYFPRFDLLQVATPEVAAAIDVHALKDLGPLMGRLIDPERTVVLHAAGQDLAILRRRTECLPARVFDTQLASAMVGYGAQQSYAALVRRVTGVQLAKTESLTDWARRPLRPEQIEYALDDVRYLLPVYDHLVQALAELGRTAWFEEESRRMVDPARFSPADVRERWRRLSVRYALNGRQTAVLEELAAWREAYAMRKDLPPRAVLPDEVLPHLARRQPSSLNELREIRQIFDRTVQECGQEMLAAVRRGLERPESVMETQAAPEEPPSGLLELLDAVVRSRAEEGRIAPGLLVAPGDLERLVSDVREGRETEVELVRGWRYDLAGQAVLQVLQGQAVVRIDASGRVKLELSVRG